MLTQDSKSSKWELARYAKLEDARSFAIAHGWRASPQKVQIRAERTGWDHSLEYVIEPYESDCHCRNIIKPF